MSLGICKKVCSTRWESEREMRLREKIKNIILLWEDARESRVFRGIRLWEK